MPFINSKAGQLYPTFQSPYLGTYICTSYSTKIFNYANKYISSVSVTRIHLFTNFDAEQRMDSFESSTNQKSNLQLSKNICLIMMYRPLSTACL